LNSKYKFLISGGINTAVTFSLYALFIMQGVDYNLSLTITYLIGIFLGFMINRLWTFKEERSLLAKTKRTNITASTQFIQYFLVYVLIFSI